MCVVCHLMYNSKSGWRDEWGSDGGFVTQYELGPCEARGASSSAFNRIAGKYCSIFCMSPLGINRGKICEISNDLHGMATPGVSRGSSYSTSNCKKCPQSRLVIIIYWYTIPRKLIPGKVSHCHCSNLIDFSCSYTIPITVFCKSKFLLVVVSCQTRYHLLHR